MGPDGMSQRNPAERAKPGRHRPRRRRGLCRQGVRVRPRSVALVPSTFSQLRSSFGRRILLLFALCIVVPGAIFGYLSLRQVEEKFHAGNDAADAASEPGDRHVDPRRDFFHSAPRWNSSPASWETGRLPLPSIVGLGLVVPRPASPRRDPFPLRLPSRAETLYGNPCLPPPQTDAARRHLASGHGLLYLQQNAGGSTPPLPGPRNPRESPGTGTAGLRGEPGLSLGTRAGRRSAGDGGRRPVPGRSAPFPDPALAGRGPRAGRTGAAQGTRRKLRMGTGVRDAAGRPRGGLT